MKETQLTPEESKLFTKKILALAKKHPDAKKALKELAPDAFPPEPIDPYELLDSIKEMNPSSPIQIRTGGELAYKGLFLHPKYTWHIVKDDYEHEVLLCYKND